MDIISDCTAWKLNTRVVYTRVVVAMCHVNLSCPSYQDTNWIISNNEQTKETIIIIITTTVRV